ncbi:hypothetical protein J2Z79_003501 [Symbiobacterium terraclitae]|uniref:ABC transporter permease n=1 Tax=Symbiobacterium terraclitae TaxID=557451 RepID=A0ABS4JWY7_9FIRM|nr:hypothetical protein [Symbiobacterium terraclitae]MBP2020047.1 hypothetical protein [Symbiobacterium terraclitae]
MRRFLLHARVLVDGSWLLPPALAAGWLLFVSLTGDPRTPASQWSTLFENVAEMIIPLTAGLWCAPIPCLDYQAGWAESRLAMDERPWLRLLEKAAVPAAALALFSLVLIGVAAAGGAPVAPGRFLLLAGPPALALSGAAVAGSSLARHIAGGLALGVGWWLADWLTGGVIPQVYLFRLSRPSVTGGNPAVQTICLILLGLSLWALTLWLAARRERWLR